jgi:hypothetical protein
MPSETIKNVLADANLTESQIEQIANLVLAERARLRTLHANEVKMLTESKDSVIESLARENVERQQQLDEAVKRAPDAEEVALIERNIRREVTASARTMLAEALAPYRNHIRAVRNYAAMTDLVESVRDAFAKIYGESALVSAGATPVALNESKNDGGVVAVLGARVQELETQLFESQCRAAFAAGTVALAETSKAKVKAIVAASTFTTLDEYNSVLAAAVAGVKNAKGESTNVNLDEAKKPQGSSQMSRYVAALGVSRAV